MDDGPTTQTPTMSVGDTLTLTPTTMAHGGEAIAHAPDGRVVFVAGAIPGDTATVTLTKVKKNWARGEAQSIETASRDRVDPVCPAAEAGAGCCDYSHIAPSAQERLKREILVGQLDKFARPSGVLTGFDLAIDLEQDTLAPLTGWRTRVRLGVGPNGRAGMRRARSNDVVAGVRCTQVAPEALDGIVGDDARRFTAGAELVVVIDSRGTRHVVETQRAQRGKRIERVETRIEGDPSVTEVVPAPAGSGTEEAVFRFPPTAFWQAHTTAPATYCRYIADWAADTYARPVGWDLYGGVGLFVPSISDALGSGAHVVSVDYSAAATRDPQPALNNFDVEVRNQKVEASIDGLPDPGLVVLDPPRTGAGTDVVEAVAARAPQRVIHIGCDPATFSRDLAAWGESGYVVERMALIDAFPNTHHFEVLTSLVPAETGNEK
ncbi:tRNA/tmRNA/rRNA uracil-C5-methylase, TrmA/RlmC/RlmD family [Corynebacterium appendicis CIP 107643]|uniref:tRNA/tmRNA/rRNA uracil-C5-methylase, TrmA/RlmC/RlmD family n=1 Tax=Corynebacterium appendicis CIP 107643 TaxID=1161099 RepID=A0A1N7J3T4_9CORY|nr:TRAM domain-containing protein [Corynebacterium appendicis]WJY61288.1 putative RNA methyltransferase [Corynebacterium appendicis CIP 107643]SIS44018.1 tRNA/tmRNA/rRNA uracil-C5-methylase, TrmA/RlmC/RlmD family [Corynebacterium appendicis CIP 107643]